MKSKIYPFVYREVLAIALEVSAVIRRHSLNTYGSMYH